MKEYIDTSWSGYNTSNLWNHFFIHCILNYNSTIFILCGVGMFLYFLTMIFQEINVRVPLNTNRVFNNPLHAYDLNGIWYGLKSMNMYDICILNWRILVNYKTFFEDAHDLNDNGKRRNNYGIFILNWEMFNTFFNIFKLFSLELTIVPPHKKCPCQWGISWEPNIHNFLHCICSTLNLSFCFQSAYSFYVFEWLIIAHNAWGIFKWIVSLVFASKLWEANLFYGYWVACYCTQCIISSLFRDFHKHNLCWSS